MVASFQFGITTSFLCYETPDYNDR
jgi:hypothetical protein